MVHLCFRFSQICGRLLNTWGSRGSLRKEMCIVSPSFPRRSWWGSAHSTQEPALIGLVRERFIDSCMKIHNHQWHLLVIFPSCMQSQDYLFMLQFNFKRMWIFGCASSSFHAVTMNCDWSIKYQKITSLKVAYMCVLYKKSTEGILACYISQCFSLKCFIFAS